jgi:thiamine biosynthesis lipoprotein
VGIERPEARAASRIGWVVRLADAALATSGDYRTFFEWEGQRHSHVIDPRSGHPVAHRLVSVSVLAPEAARADAWATALLVLGPEAGWRVAEQEELAALFVVDRDGAGLEARATRALEPHRER